MKSIVTLFVLLATTVAFAIDYTAVQIRDDFLSEGFEYCTFRYYYFIPCPEASWFWVLTGWQSGTRLGMHFGVNDPQIGGQGTQAPNTATSMEAFRFLDLAGYATMYPGLHTVRFDIYCADRNGRVYGHLWSSGPVETRYGWNWIVFPGGLHLCGCMAPPEDKHSSSARLPDA